MGTEKKIDENILPNYRLHECLHSANLTAKGNEQLLVKSENLLKRDLDLDSSQFLDDGRN